MARIGIDVDGTILDICPDWIKHIVKELGISAERVPELICDFYNTPIYNVESWLSKRRWIRDNHDREKVINFWEGKYIYTGAKIFDDFTNVFRNLCSRQDHDIIFISHCKEGHRQNKEKVLRDFNDRTYPQNRFYFIGTKFKQFINVDCMIDDCPDVHINMKKYNPDCLCIYINRDLPRIEAPEEADYNVKNWKQIGNILEEHEYL